MIRFLPLVIEMGLLIFCLIECIRTPQDEVRNLPKLVWVILIVILPLIGGIAWLVAGRPLRPATRAPWRSTETAGFPEYERPASARAVDDIDEQLRRDQEQVDREHEEALRRWEQSLKDRERKLKDDGTD